MGTSVGCVCLFVFVCFFFFNDPATTEIYTLSLHDALPIYCTNRDMGGQPDAPRGDGVYRPVLARGDGHLMYLMARSPAPAGGWPVGKQLALVWTPLIWIAQAGAVVANALGVDIALHGYTLWHQRFVFLSSALFACAAVLLGARLARRLIGGAWSPAHAAIAILLGTSLAYYATYMPSYSHAMDAL